MSFEPPLAVCPACGVDAPPGTSFCQACGTRLRSAPPAGGVALMPGESTHAPPEPRPPERSGQAPRALGAGARLVAVRRDGTDGATYPIASEQFDIGRGEGDLMFDDAHLGRRHARIAFEDGGYVLHTLEPRNGVYLRLRGAVEVAAGDRLLVGKQVLEFETPTEAEMALRPASEHGMMLFGTPLRSPWGRLRQITAAGTTRDVYHLYRQDIVIGREQGDIIFSDDEFLSRRHAQLSLRHGRTRLEDLGSSNGTFIKLRAPHALTPGELIRVGDELLRFEIA